jgi:hypothetical protein
LGRPFPAHNLNLNRNLNLIRAVCRRSRLGLRLRLRLRGGAQDGEMRPNFPNPRV